MTTFKNLLRGVGSVLGALGTAPRYRVPGTMGSYTGLTGLQHDVRKVAGLLSSNTDRFFKQYATRNTRRG